MIGSISALALLIPEVASATQGRADSCMILTIGFFNLPAALTMIGLGINSIVRLSRKAPPGPKAGLPALVLSVAGFCLCVVLGLYCMSVADWEAGYCFAMLKLSSPALALSASSAVLAWFVKRRARLADVAVVEEAVDG